MKAFTPKFEALILGLILAAGAVLRRWGLPERGMWFWDEGIFYQAARFARWRLSGGGGDLPPTLGYEEAWASTVGFPTNLWKPVHIWTASAWFSLTGESYGAFQWLILLFALATIALAWWLARMLAGPWAGLAAATLLALSPYHAYYSRVALSEVNGAFWALAAAACLVWRLRAFESGRTHLAIALPMGGLFYGLAFGSSYRFLLLGPLFGGMCALAAGEGILRKKRTWPEIRSLALECLGFYAVFGGALGLIEAIHRSIYRPPFTFLELPSYFLTLAQKFGSGESSFNFEHLGYYPMVLSEFEGYVWVALAGGALLYALSRWRELPLLTVAAFVVCPCAVFALTTTRLTRTVSGVAPFLCVLMGVALAHGAQWLSQRTQREWAGGVAVAALLLATTVEGFTTIGFHSLWLPAGHAEALAWVEAQQGNTKHLSTMWPVTFTLTDRQSARRLPTTMSPDLPGELAEQGYRYLLVDWQQYVMSPPLVAAVQAAMMPVRAFPNPYGAALPVLGENYLPDDRRRIGRLNPHTDKILVYDLSQWGASQ